MTEITPWQLMLMGGPMMVPLLMCFVLGLAVAVQKGIFLASLGEDVPALTEKIRRSVLENDIKGALAACDISGTPLARVLRAGLMQSGRSGEEISMSMEEAARAEIPVLEEWISLLALIGRVAPLFGLLGTVMGMAASFHHIQVRGEALNPVTSADIAGGVWQALLTTAAGLLVAAVAVIAHHSCCERVKGYVVTIETTARSLARFLGPAIVVPAEEQRG